MLPRSENVEMGLSTTSTPTPSPRAPLRPPPPLPQPPANVFVRDAIIDDLLGFVERFASLTLFGAGGIGKSTIALTLLHHVRIVAKFGEYRHFVRCDGLVDSPDGFLGRLSHAIGASGVTQLWSHLTLSPPRLLVLDGVDFILDPLAPGATEVAAAIEEFGRYHNICILATSRMDVKIPDFRHVEVPSLSMDSARDTFHSCCGLGRSPAVENLLAEFDFHPLSIDLLASAARENNWDERKLLKAWDGGKTSILKASGRQSLEDNIESILLTPTIQVLGITARKTLESIALFPEEVKESKLECTFPKVRGVGEAVDALCKFSLLYRQDGFVKMLSPFRFYFAESARATNADEDIRYIGHSVVDLGSSFSLPQFYGRE